MSKDWNNREETSQIQEVIQVDDTVAVTLTNELLDFLKVSVGEAVQVEMKDHKLIVRKIIPHEPPEGFSEDFFRTLNEKVEKYDVTLKSVKN